MEMGEQVKYDCRQCAEQPELYELLGHDGPPTFWWDKNAVSGEFLECCPVMTLIRAGKDAHEFKRMEEDYSHYKAGHLKVEGGIADQPARWLGWMRAIDGMVTTVQIVYNKAHTPQQSE